MNPNDIASPPPRTAADLCRLIPLTPAARPLLADGLPPIAFLHRLVEHGRYADALRFLAQGLLPRPSVWWACLCAQHAAEDNLSPPEDAALRAAVAWVVEPSAANQQAAQSASTAATLNTPAGCTARAAYWCGHASATDQPPVPLRAELTAKLAGASALLAAARSQPAAINWTYRQLIALALDVDCGLNTWRAKETRKAP